MQIFKILFSILWLVFVAGWYFAYHSYYANSLSFASGLTIVFLFWALVLGFLWWVVHQRARQNSHAEIQFNLFHILAAFVGVTFFTGVLLYAVLDPGVFTSPHQLIIAADGQAALVGEEAVVNDDDEIAQIITRGSVLNNWSEAKSIFPPEIQAFFTHESVLFFAGHLAWNLLKFFGFWIGLLVLFYGLGSFLMRSKEHNAFSFFRALGFGMGFCMLVLFILGVLGWLIFPILASVFVVLFGVSFFKIPELFRVLKSFSLSVEKKDFLSLLMLLFIAFFFVGLNVIDIFSPVPAGYDSLHLYQNIPRLLAHYHHLISGIDAYNLGLLNGLTFILFNSTILSMGLTLFIGILAILMLFWMLRRVFSLPNAVMLVTLFLSLPMVNFLMHTDLKVDLPLFFFSLLSIACTIEWYRHRDETTAVIWLIQIGIFLGIAFGMKYTSFLLIATIFAFYAWVTWGLRGVLMGALLSTVALNVMGITIFSSLPSEFVFIVQMILGAGAFALFISLLIQKKFRFSDLKPFVVTGFFVALLFSPWLAKNALETQSFEPYLLLQGARQKVVIDRELIGVEEKSCEHIVDYSDWGRYIGNFKGSSLVTPFVVLWESTVNSGLENNRISDISFLFLGFLMLGVWVFIERRKQHPEWRILCGFFIFYLVLWLVAGRGVVWYGMPIFLGLLYFYGHAWKVERWPIFVVILWFLMSIPFRATDTLSENISLLYAGGVTDESIVIQQRVPGAEAFIAALNRDESLSKNVYLVGTFLTYFIEENNRRVYFDQTMEDFKCLFRDEDPQVTLDRLRKANFGYVVYSKHALGAEQDPNGPMHEQFEWFEWFAGEFLEEEVARGGVMVYGVPGM